MGQFRHTGARGVEHPDNVAEDGFLDNGESEVLVRDAVVADEGGDEEGVVAGAVGFGGPARGEAADRRVRRVDDSCVLRVRGEAEQEVEEGEVGFDRPFPTRGSGSSGRRGRSTTRPPWLNLTTMSFMKCSTTPTSDPCFSFAAWASSRWESETSSARTERQCERDMGKGNQCSKLSPCTDVLMP